VKQKVKASMKGEINVSNGFFMKKHYNDKKILMTKVPQAKIRYPEKIPPPRSDPK